MQEDYTVPEREVDLEQSEIERGENTNPRVLEWMHNLQTDEKEAENIQQVDVSAMKHVKTGNPIFGWTASDPPLEIPPDSLTPAPSTGSGGRTYPHRTFDDKEAQGNKID